MRSQLNSIASFRGGDERYSARASFHFPGIVSGEVLDINVADRLCSLNLYLVVAAFYCVAIPSFLVLLWPASTFVLRVACVSLGGCTILLCFILLLLSNKKLINRILLHSLTPYIKLYLCIVESYSICSLLGWSWRSLVACPMLISSQLCIFISDAVFYRDTRHTVCLLVLFIAYRVGLIFCVRYSVFGNLQYDVFTFSGFKFFNSGNFVSKSLSLVLFSISQLVFYCKYKRRLFSVRTCYTIMNNREWNDLERKQRLSIQEEKEIEVMRTKHMLVPPLMPPSPQSSDTSDDLYKV